MAIGFVDGQIGQRVIYHFINKYKRPSIMVLCLGTIIALACMALTIYQSLGLYTSWTTTAEMFAIETAWATCAYWQ
jgi:hypothetical protein